MRTRLVLVVSTCVVMIATTACMDATGQLAQHQIELPCAPGDAACEQAGLFAPLAAGATIPITLAPQVLGSASPAVHLIPVDESVATVEAAQITGVGTGVTAILARVPAGDVVDLTHIWVDVPQRLSFHRVVSGVVDDRPLDDRLDVLSAEVAELAFTFKLWSQGRELMGDAKETWTVDSDEDFVLMNEGHARARRLLLPEEGATGTAFITVDALGFTHTLQLEIVR